MATTGLAVFTPATAQATYATGGTGLYKDQINWFDWGTADETIPAAGLTKTTTQTIGSSTLATTCTVSNVDGSKLRTYIPGSYKRDSATGGDSFDAMYNVGGSGQANTLVSGLAVGPGDTDDEASAKFDFDCSATLDGTKVPLDGLVMSLSESPDTRTGEYDRATIPDGAEWYMIDRYRNTPCESDDSGVTRDGQTLTFTGGACVPIGAGVGYMKGATSAQVDLHGVVGGSREAISLGIVMSSDFGDAPQSYGDAGALFQTSVSGNPVPTGDTGIFSDSLAKLDDATSTHLGAGESAEDSSQYSSGANADTFDDGISSPGTINASPGSKYQQNGISCTGTGTVYGWIDWNNNGTFDSNERSSGATCADGKANITWTVPASVTSGSSYMRLRIAGDAAGAAKPTGVTTSGEVEDYPVTIAVPSYTLSKTADKAFTLPGDKVTYTVTVKNTGKVDYTAASPAAFTDDLSKVTDDATYNNDATNGATVSGNTLSWSGALAVGATKTITYSATVKNPDAGDKVLENTVTCTVDAIGCTPPPPVRTPVKSFTVAKKVDLRVAGPGDKVTYTVTVKNTGKVDYTAASPAAFTDDLSKVTDDATYNNDATNGATVSGNTLSWSGALAVGATKTITYSATVKNPDTGDHKIVNVIPTPPNGGSCATVGGCTTHTTVTTPPAGPSVATGGTTTAQAPVWPWAGTGLLGLIMLITAAGVLLARRNQHGTQDGRD